MLLHAKDQLPATHRPLSPLLSLLSPLFLFSSSWTDTDRNLRASTSREPPRRRSRSPPSTRPLSLPLAAARKWGTGCGSRFVRAQASRCGHAGGHHRERSLSPRPSTRLNRWCGWRAGLVLHELAPHQHGGGGRGGPTRAGPACSPCSRWSCLLSMLALELADGAHPWREAAMEGGGGQAHPWREAVVEREAAASISRELASRHASSAALLGGGTSRKIWPPAVNLRRRGSIRMKNGFTGKATAGVAVTHGSILFTVLSDPCNRLHTPTTRIGACRWRCLASDYPDGMIDDGDDRFSSIF